MVSQALGCARAELENSRKKAELVGEILGLSFSIG
jgi:hypothetical protein